MWWVVDRVEGAIAVMVSDSGLVTHVRARGVKEGQVFRWTKRGWVRDRTEEQRRTRAARAQLEQLKRTDPGGNIQL